MSGMFSKPKSPKLPPPQKVQETQEVTVENEEEVKRKQKRLMANKGRAENLLAGLQNALKQRLGE